MCVAESGAIMLDKLPSPEGLQYTHARQLEFNNLGCKAYWGHIGIIENRMETTILYYNYRGYIGVLGASGS